MIIGQRIRNRRIELGLTQDELAAKTGYKSRSSINKIECSRNLPLTKVEQMAKALECTPSYLMGWEDEVENIEMDTLVDIVLDNEIRSFVHDVVKLRNEDVKKFENLKSYMEFLKVGHN